jgi:hypothetical protein
LIKPHSTKINIQEEEKKNPKNPKRNTPLLLSKTSTSSSWP